MIAVGISSIMVGGMYQTFVNQQKLSAQQEQFTEARQNARLSMEVMTEEIREAGFDPGGLTLQDKATPTGPAGIVEANATSLRFTRDLNCNGKLSKSTPADIESDPDSPSEDVAYYLDTAKHVLRRTTRLDGQLHENAQPVASNIIELNFCYVLSTNAGGPCTSTPQAGDRSNITAVQVTLTATASANDPTYRDTNPNYSAQYQHYRKATFTSVIRLRNLGLNRGQGPNDPPMVVDVMGTTCKLPSQ
jgi:type IV pilus assembly protein PilW